MNIIKIIRTSLVPSQIRSSKIIKSILGLSMLKVLSMAFGLVLIPMTLGYLGPVKYGVWLTLGSIVGWAGFFDLGLSNGLRNKLGEALAKDDIQLAKSLVSTTLIMLSGIGGFIYLIFWLINPLLNWLEILNAPASMAVELHLVVIIVFSFFTLRFISGLIITVLMTDQRPALADSISTAGTFLSLMIIYFLTMTTKGSLIYVGIAFSASTVLVPLLAGVWFFTRSYRKISPSFSYVDFSLFKSLSGQGLHFFGIQLAALVLFSTDNIIIAQIFGPEEVVPYNIAYKLFSYVVMAFGVVMTPFWAVYNEAYNKHDLLWIKRTTNKMLGIWAGLVIGVVILFLLSGNIFQVWLGDQIAVPTSISFFMAINVIVQTFNMIFVTFVFSTGKLRIQIYTALIAALINIPLSYLFAKVLGLGPAGVILATAVCGAPNLFLSPIQYHKLIHERAQGIWDK